MKKEDMKSFILYHDLIEPLMMLSVRERGEWITAVFAYETGCRDIMPPRLSPKAEMLLSIVMKALDRNREAYEKKCEKRAANGRRGGRPKRESLNDGDEKTNWFLEKAKKAYNKNDNQNKNNNLNQNDSDSGSGNGNGNENESRATESDGEFSTTPSSQDEPTATANHPSQSQKEPIKLFQEIPREYVRSRLDRAYAYAEEYDLSICNVLVTWWLKDREAFLQAGDR